MIRAARGTTARVAGCLVAVALVAALAIADVVGMEEPTARPGARDHASSTATAAALRRHPRTMLVAQLAGLAVIGWQVVLLARPRPADAAATAAPAADAPSETTALRTELVELQVSRHEERNRRRAVQNMMDDLELKRERLEREVAERLRAEELFRRLTESAPYGVLLVEDDGGVLLANRESERIFGVARDEIVGRELGTLVSDPQLQATGGANQGVAAGRAACSLGGRREMQGTRADGETVPLEVAYTSVELPAGSAVLCTIIDITERKQAEERLAAYAALLKSSNDDLQQFAYVVSHDLKAPLRGIASVAGWLAEDFGQTVDEEARENLDLMLERTDRLDRLIDGILAYSRAGRATMTQTEVDAHALVLDVVSSIDPGPGIEVRVDGRLPSVRYDETQLRQVFQNLLSNAITHLGKPSGTITVAAAPADDGWRFSVKDDGVGIPERHMERIFGLFQTLKSKDEGRTTGVGLSIVKRIVERNGGSVQVHSTEGAGTEFVFSVPSVPSAEPDPTGVPA